MQAVRALVAMPWSIATTGLPLLSQWESSRLGVAVSILLILAHARPFTGEISIKPDALLQVMPEAARR
jgi:hypothetical protein